MVFGVHLSVVEGLAACFGFEAAGFEEMDVDAFVGEAFGEDQAGYASADDADGAVEWFAGLLLGLLLGWVKLQVDVHREASLLRGERRVTGAGRLRG